jgi:hypothetical protein
MKPNHFLETFFVSAWGDFLSQPTSQIPVSNKMIEILESFLARDLWHRVLSFMEFFLQKFAAPLGLEAPVGGEIDRIFREQNAQFKVVGKLIVPAMREQEAGAIEEALIHPLETVRIQLRASLEFLAKRPEPDCRNSIASAISAVAFSVQNRDKSGKLGSFRHFANFTEKAIDS